MSYPDTTNYDELEKSICKYFWNKVSVPLGSRKIDEFETIMYDKFTKSAAEYVRTALHNNILKDLTK